MPAALKAAIFDWVMATIRPDSVKVATVGPEAQIPLGQILVEVTIVANTALTESIAVNELESSVCCQVCHVLVVLLCCMIEHALARMPPHVKSHLINLQVLICFDHQTSYFDASQSADTACKATPSVGHAKDQTGVVLSR